MSADRNAFTPIDIFGLVFGFIVFATGYIYVVSRVFIDTIQKGKAFDEEIENDLMVMHQLGMDGKMDEITSNTIARVSLVEFNVIFDEFDRMVVPLNSVA
jgi:hypothetical protein